MRKIAIVPIHKISSIGSAILLLLLLFFSLSIRAQTKPRKPPTQQELDAMKAEMQKAMDKMSPEQKRMMEEMGMKMPTGQQLDDALAIATANPGARGGFPKLNPRKIAAIAPTPTVAGIAGFLSKLNTSVSDGIGAKYGSQAEELLTQLKKKTTDPGELGKGAVGLWMMGQGELAVVLAGKIAAMDPGYAENLNNYAAMLTMMDAQHLAMPVLQYLHRQYPGNETILNNIGQAWFGMGEMKKAEQYLDSAIQRFPKHSQANNTKSQIQEERGDKKGAAESLKNSLDGGFTSEKEERLRRLGYPDDDVSWPFRIPQDPLGFQHFILPEFPMHVDQSDPLREEWDKFREGLQEMEKALSIKAQELTVLVQQEGVNDVKAQMAMFKSGGATAMGPLSLRAAKKLSYLLNDKDGGLTYKLKIAEQEMMGLPAKLKVYDSIREKSMKEGLKNLKCHAGEGSTDEDRDKCCTVSNKVNSEWLRTTNQLSRTTLLAAIRTYGDFWSAQAYFLQYNMSPLAFELQKVNFKLQYIGILLAISPNFARPSYLCGEKPPKPFKPKPMAEFDDVACKYHSYYEFGLTKMETHCSKMTTTFDLDDFKLSFTEDLNKSNGKIFPAAITHATVDISVGLGSKGIGKWGPVKADVGAKAVIHIESDGRTITEVKAGVEGKVSVGTDIFDNAGSIMDVAKEGGKEMMKKTGKSVILPGADDKSITIGGAAGSVTINAGSGVSTNGSLSGVDVK